MISITAPVDEGDNGRINLAVAVKRLVYVIVRRLPFGIEVTQSVYRDNTKGRVLICGIIN